MSDPLHLSRLSTWLNDHASTPFGREQLKDKPLAEGVELERRLEAAVAWAELLGLDDTPGLHLEADCRPNLDRVRRGGQLDPSQLNEVKQLTRVLTDLRPLNNTPHASVSGLASALGDYEDLLVRLEASVGPAGDLLDGASAELGTLRARHESAKRRYAELADDLRDTLHSEGHLSDRYVTQRDDRHVLPVKAASKRQFGGVVHDASRSGKTAYVEPAQLIEAGAQVRKTEDAVRAEEQRILKRLSSLVATHATELGDDIRILGTLDADRARGAFSRTFDGVAPRFHERGIRLQALRPPALLLAGLERVVPVDMTLEAPTRVLIISGPNGGGKSVALTACAWAFELARRGVPIPAQHAELPAPPYAVAAVVGDAADDRAAHSTFSGHLESLQRALEVADQERSLIVIDEIASGTEPTAGSAIACGFLECLAERDALVVTTTHYDPVKQLGLQHPKMRAAAVRDRRDPEVAFRLFIDEVGGSHPIKLAVDLGLPDDVIARARHHLDPERRAELDQLKAQQSEATQLERLRQELRAERQELSERHDELVAQRARLEAQEAKRQRAYERDNERLQQLKGERLAQIDALRSELSETIKALRSQGGADAAKAGDRLFGQVNDLRQSAQALELTKEESAAPATTIQVGDTVRLFSGGNTGVVQEFRGNQAVVLIEGKVFHLSRKQLQRAESSSPRQARRAQRKANKAANQTIAVTDASAPTLDLRGLRPFEAEARIDRFLQQLVDADCAGRVIHGIGTGALRKKTLRYLSEGPWNVAFRGGFSTEGADGVTVVRVEG